MSIQDLGKVAYLQKGAYNSSTKYEVNDVVTYQGSSYVSNVNNNQGNLPTNATYWQVLVQKPLKGVDYFTTADKQEMVDEITEDAESEFNQNAQAKTEAFNTNASDKTGAFNQNANSKTSDFNSNATSKTTTFNENATSKTTEYNTNASDKLSAYNSNHASKIEAYNENHTSKMSAYDTNATDKTNTFDEHVSDKTDDFDSHVDDKIEQFDLHVAMLEEDVEDLRDNQIISDEVDGTDINITNAAKARVYNLEMDKISTQMTTTGKNLFDKNNPNVFNGYFSNSQITSDVSHKIVYISCSPNTTYTIQKINEGSNKRFAVGTSSEIPANHGSIIDYLRNDNVANITITTSNEATYLLIWCYVVNDTIVTFQDVLNSIQIEIGSTATTYEPYSGGEPGPSPDYPQEVKTVKGYIEDGNNYIDVKIIGKNYANIQDFICNNYETLKTINNVRGNTQYTLQFLRTRVSSYTNEYVYKFAAIKFYNSNKLISTINGNQAPSLVLNETQLITYTMTTPENCNKIVINFSTNNGDITYSVKISKLMLEKGATSTTYEDYKQPLNITLPLNNNELVGIGDYKDEYIVDKNGHCYLNKKNDKYVFDGTESFSSVTEGYYMTFNAKSTSPRTILCNSYINYLDYANFISHDYGISLLYGGSQLYIRDKDVSTTSQLTNKLATNNTIFYYTLPTPQLIDLNTTVDVHLFKGTNNITNSEDATMTIRYVEDIQSIISELQNAILEIGGE